MASNNVAVMARNLAEPFAEELGVSIWNVKFIKEGAQWYLRYFIDREDGISIDDCEAFSKAVDGPLDEADFIDCSYFLEVCSPGLERELTEPEHFQKMMGRDVLLKTYRAIEGNKNFSGKLESFENNIIGILDGENRLVFKREDVAFVKLDDASF